MHCKHEYKRLLNTVMLHAKSFRMVTHLEFKYMYEPMTVPGSESRLTHAPVPHSLLELDLERLINSI